MSQNIFLAIYEEHKARTGHDIYKKSSLSTLAFSCDVCLYLGAEKRDMDETERQHHEMQAETDVINVINDTALGELNGQEKKED